MNITEAGATQTLLHYIKGHREHPRNIRDAIRFLARRSSDTLQAGIRPDEFPDNWTPPATVAADPFHNHADNSPF